MSSNGNKRLPPGWRETPLGDLITILRGVSYKKQDATTEPALGKIPILRATNINGKLNFNDLVYVPNECVSTTQLLHVGDIVIAASSGSRHVVGKAAALTLPWIGSFGAFCYGLRPLLQETATYISLFLQTTEYRDHVSALSAGVNINNLRREHIEGVPIPVAPLNEQRRIVSKIEELFSELEKAVESLRAARAKLDVYRQTVLKHAFEGKLTALWREENEDKLETPEQLLTRIKREREARYELQLQEWGVTLKGWERGGRLGRQPARPPKLKKFSDLSLTETETLPSLPAGWCYLRLGLVIDEPKYGSSKKCDYNFTGTGVLRIPNIVGGVVDTSDLKGAQFEEDEKRVYGLKSGDILVIRSNGSISIVGSCALVSNDEEVYLYAGYLIRLRCNRKALHSEYLSILMASHLLRTQIEYKAKSTSGVNNINSGEIQSLIVPLCSLREQDVVVGLLSASLSSINAIEAEIDSELLRVDALRQSVLKKAFGGELVAQDPHDEPASVLLDRIRAERGEAA